MLFEILAFLTVYVIGAGATDWKKLRSGTAHSNEADMYDIIVVGSGLVGSTTSSRLADLLPDRRILVLEGGDEGQWKSGGRQPPAYWDPWGKAWVQWPGEWGGLTRFDIPGDYGIFTQAGKVLNSFASGQGGDSWPVDLSAGFYTAKVHGGGASINGALTQRVCGAMFEGHEEFGMSAWPESWSAAAMEPYYQEVERLFSITPTPSADGKHYLDNSGLTQLREVLSSSAPCHNPDSPGEACGAYPDGFNEISTRKPVSGAMGVPHVTASGGIRQSSATLLQPKALLSPNYTLSTQSEVTKILHKDGIAAGVNYTQNGFEKTAQLAKGGLVLLSAGAIGTPRLLLSSGIGDTNIVGKEISDHGMTRQFFHKAGWNLATFDFPPSQDVITSYSTHHSGPLAQFGPLMTAFIRDPTTPGAPDEYDVEVFVNPTDSSDQLIVWYVLMRPTCSKVNLKWTGSTLVRENDGLYFACPRDAQTMQYARDVVAARMTALGATCVTKGQDSCGHAWSLPYPINHFAGGCSLGKCVDPETLRVHGSENVAVADASILPGQVWGHPAMTLEALAFRAADLLVASIQPLQPPTPPPKPPTPSPSPSPSPPPPTPAPSPAASKWPRLPLILGLIVGVVSVILLLSLAICKCRPRNARSYLDTSLGSSMTPSMGWSPRGSPPSSAGGMGWSPRGSPPSSTGGLQRPPPRVGSSDCLLLEESA